MMYRDLFDHFLDYLERMNHYIKIRLISAGDVGSLRYWLEQLDRPRFLPANEQQLFRIFIDRYHYDGVRELMSLFLANKA
jgi:hypothetical protein